MSHSTLCYRMHLICFLKLVCNKGKLFLVSLNPKIFAASFVSITLIIWSPFLCTTVYGEATKRKALNEGTWQDCTSGVRICNVAGPSGHALWEASSVMAHQSYCTMNTLSMIQLRLVVNSFVSNLVYATVSPDIVANIHLGSNVLNSGCLADR